MKKVDFTRSTMAEQLWARSTHHVQDVPAATTKVTHSMYQPFQSILEQDGLSAHRKPVTQCPSLLYWRMSPCYDSS